MADTQYDEGAEHAIRILREIKKAFDGGMHAVYAGSLLFEDDDALQTHIENALHDVDALPDPD